jgi:hypothetical protein
LQFLILTQVDGNELGRKRKCPALLFEPRGAFVPFSD